MAVAARLGPSDARVPCPLCGGLIHPIAGKCKHCKADLTSYRAARPAANAQLPALHPSPGPNGHANEHASAHAAHARNGHAVPMPAAPAYDASQPVLPPRPTGGSHAAEPRASGLRSWPVLVIILATVAIVAAVVLMVWPSNRQDPGGKRTIGPPPAPERMQTEPEIKPPLPNPQANPQATPQAKPQVPSQPTPAPSPPAGATLDPWSGNQVDPPPPAPGTGPSDPDTDTSSDDDLDALTNPLDPPQAPTAPGRQRLPLHGRGTVMLTVMEHVCRKMLECSAGDPMARRTCDSLARRSSPPPASCPAANRCIHLIDAMSCDGQGDNLAQLSSLMLQLRDCTDAMQC